MVFGPGHEAWIDRVDDLPIGLPGDECRDTFLRVVAGRRFVTTDSGELTVCRRRQG